MLLRMNDSLIRVLTRRALLSLLVLTGLQATLLADGSTPAKSDAKTVRLLTVGNSFSANATGYLGDLAKARGNVLIHRPIVVGGASLELHWGRAELHEKDPQDPAGLYGKRSLKQELASQPWDFVTIQQASIKSHDPATYRPFAKQLRDSIKQHSPQAELLIHQTWAYRRDDPRFSVAKPKPGEPATQAEMYQMLTDAYTTIADELGLRRIPVGDAYYLADTDPQWGYQPDQSYDFQQQEPTTLPNQTHSLHVGWRLTKAKDGSHKLTMDGHHANSAGEYLGACVWYEVLFGDSAVGNEFIPMGLAKDDARFLQETAHKAVIASRIRKLSAVIVPKLPLSNRRAIAAESSDLSGCPPTMPVNPAASTIIESVMCITRSIQ